MRRFSQFVIFSAAALLPMASATAGAQTNFGSVSVGGSATQSVTFTLSKAVTVGSIVVVTQGATGLDFTDAGTGTCTAGTAYAAGATCTVAVKFKPMHAGFRFGAARLKNNSGAVLLSSHVWGTGTGPELGIATGSPANLGRVYGGETVGGSGLAVNGAGDLFVVDWFNNRILEFAAAGGAVTSMSPTVNGEGLNFPFGATIDGSGDLYVADRGNNRIVEVRAIGGLASAIDPTVNGVGLSSPRGVATDGAGDLFIADEGNNRVVEVPFGGGAATAIDPTVNGIGLQDPQGVALDAAGDLFIADYSNNRVIEAPGGGGAATAINLAAGGYSLFGPNAIALDAATVYVSDYENDRIVEAPLGGGNPTTFSPPPLGAYQFAFPESLTVDGAGDIFIAANANIYDFGRSQTQSLTYEDTAVGSTSFDSPQTAIVQNMGNEALTLSGIVYAGDFPESNGGALPACTSSTVLGAGQECNLNVDFIPFSSGTLNENLKLTDNSLNVSGAQQSLELNGIGGFPPNPMLSATTMTFGTQNIGTVSATKTITFTNTSNVELRYLTITPIGPDAASFVFENSCDSEAYGLTPVAPGATCVIQGQLTPVKSGPLSTELVLSDGYGNPPLYTPYPPLYIGVTGTGATAPIATLSTNFLVFDPQTLQSSSPSQTVTVTNTGTEPLNISNIKIYPAIIGTVTITTGTTAFQFSDNCGAAVAPGASCTINVWFAPTQAGEQNAVLVLSDNIPGVSSPEVGMGGTGVIGETTTSLSASSLTFGAEEVGATSASQSVTLTNTGSSGLYITNIGVTGADASSFVFANSCGTSVAPGASCTIHGHFTPAAAGALSAAVTITDNSSSSPQIIPLTGTGEAALSLSAVSLSFGSEAIGVTSGSQTVTMTNTGPIALSISSIAVTGPDATSFIFANSCGFSLAVGASCTVHGHFTPATTGALTAAILVADNATGSPQSISVGGTGIASNSTTLTFSASSVTFASQPVGTTSASQTVTLTNTGSAAMAINSVVVTGPYASSFDFSSSCGSGIAAGANCTIHGHMTPTTAGSLTAAVTITDTATGSPQSILLTGTGQ